MKINRNSTFCDKVIDSFQNESTCNTLIKNVYRILFKKPYCTAKTNETDLK